MKANIQWHCDHCGTVRIVETKFGDPPYWVCTIERRGATAWFHGVMWWDDAYRPLIRAALRSEGFTELKYLRRLEDDRLVERVLRV